MDQSSSLQSKSKHKSWNVFRSPDQKDLFDLPDHQQNEKQSPSQKQNALNRLIKERQIKQDNQNSWRSNMTFATQYHDQDESSKIKSQRSSHNRQLFFKSMHHRSKKNILNQEEDQMLLTERLKQNDSLSNIFLKQVVRTEQNLISSSHNKKTKLFENISMHTNDKISTLIDNEMILKTLNDIRDINKQNLTINKKILQSLHQQRKTLHIRQKTDKIFKFKQSKSIQKKTSQKKKYKAFYDQNFKEFMNNQTLPVKSHIKNHSNKSNNKSEFISGNILYNHNLTGEDFSQSRKQFYLYEKPLKASSNSKLSYTKSNYGKKTQIGNLTRISNRTKFSLNQNPRSQIGQNYTKLSLGEKSLRIIRPKASEGDKHTLKKLSKISPLMAQDKIRQKLNQIERIKVSLNRLIKEKTITGLEKTNSKTTNKKKTQSQSIIRC